eukprot:6184910-Pleurochrysis_carterae.AAC.5
MLWSWARTCCLNVGSTIIVAVAVSSRPAPAALGLVRRTRRRGASTVLFSAIPFGTSVQDRCHVRQDQVAR